MFTREKSKAALHGCAFRLLQGSFNIKFFPRTTTDCCVVWGWATTIKSSIFVFSGGSTSSALALAAQSFKETNCWKNRKVKNRPCGL
jgi:hypothetical protein